MLTFRKEVWLGNRWPGIEIEPVEAAYFPRVLLWLSKRHGFAMPRVQDTLDGHAAEFTILGSRATMLVDAWSFSIGFEQEAARDEVLAELAALPGDAFD